jgi:hypothetical protein
VEQHVISIPSLPTLRTDAAEIADSQSLVALEELVIGAEQLRQPGTWNPESVSQLPGT